MNRSKRISLVLALVVGAMILGPARMPQPASASPSYKGSAPTPPPPPARRASPSAKPPKGEPPPLDPATVPAVTDCVKAAYARLATETALLAKTHLSDTAAFALAYRARKEAIVGKAALRAAGCKAPGEK